MAIRSALFLMLLVCVSAFAAGKPTPAEVDDCSLKVIRLGIAYDKRNGEFEPSGQVISSKIELGTTLWVTEFTSEGNAFASLTTSYSELKAQTVSFRIEKLKGMDQVQLYIRLSDALAAEKTGARLKLISFSKGGLDCQVVIDENPKLSRADAYVTSAKLTDTVLDLFKGALITETFVLGTGPASPAQ